MPIAMFTQNTPMEFCQYAEKTSADHVQFEAAGQTKTVNIVDTNANGIHVVFQQAILEFGRLQSRDNNKNFWNLHVVALKDDRPIADGKWSIACARRLTTSGALTYDL